MKKKNHPPVSTLSLFGYLSTVVAWELEIGIVLLQNFAKQKPGLVAIVVLLVLSIGLTAFSGIRGKKDFARLRKTKGRIELSGTQAVLVTVFMIFFGATIGLIAMHMNR